MTRGKEESCCTMELTAGSEICLFHADSDFIEVRNSKGKSQFCSLDEAEQVAYSMNADHDVWFNVNPARRPSHGAISDADIICRRWIVVDCDPIRADGVKGCAADGEKAHAKLLSRDVSKYTKALGLPEPILCDSGNGYHLWYRIDDLPVESSLVGDFLNALSGLFTDFFVKIDTAMASASRMVKFYGTWSRKGEDSEDRPHRQSCVVNTPEHRDVISETQLRLAIRTMQDAAHAADSANSEPNTIPFAGDRPGGDFARRVTWAAIYEPHGFTVRGESNGKIKLSHPDADSEISATIGSLSRNGEELFVNFSESLGDRYGLPVHGRGGKGVGKFGLYAILNHGGDYRKAAQILASQGYGASRNGVTETQTGRGTIAYRRITSSELQDGDYSLEYLIKGIMVSQQPMIVAGPQKSLKTSLLIDLAVTLSSGGYFLGRFPASRAATVCMMTGESGLSTIQETATRVARAAGRRLDDLDIIWSPDLPRFDDAEHHLALKDFLTADEIEVLIIDPAYLTMPGADAGNLFAQGELLRNMVDVCQSVGVQMVLAHHTKKNRAGERYDPLVLPDLAWAGFAEFARQWILINRREEYQPGSGDHRLWLSIGGSAGHNGLYALDVAEGGFDAENPQPRIWDVSVRSLADARRDVENRKEVEKARKREKQEIEDRRRFLEAIRQFPDGETARTIRDAAGLSGKAAGSAIRALQKEGRIEAATIQKSGKDYDGWKPTRNAL